MEEKLRGKEREREELCQNRDEAEAVSKAGLDTLKSALDTIKTSTQQISKYIYILTTCISCQSRVYVCLDI